MADITVITHYAHGTHISIVRNAEGAEAAFISENAHVTITGPFPNAISAHLYAQHLLSVPEMKQSTICVDGDPIRSYMKAEHNRN